MSALSRKLLRDLWSLRAQALAIVTVLASGVGIFVAVMGAYASIVGALADYYERDRFADVFAQVNRAPLSLVPRIEAIPGVAEVRARVVTDAAADVPGVVEPVSIHLVSVPARGGSFLNGVRLRRGSLPEREDEIVLSEPFALANDLGPGSSLSVRIHGHARTLRVVGVGLSPEFVFLVRPGELLPDDRRYGVAWMEERALASAMDMSGAFDDAVISLAAGASQPAVLEEIDRLLLPYGSLGAHGRDDVVSHRFLTAKMKQLRVSASYVPVLFLGVAAFLLNVVLGRLVATQRSQIGTLKAFGYTDADIGLHYLELVAVIVAIGSIAGVALGVWMGHGMMILYRPYYRFPNLDFHVDPPSIATAVLIAAAASAVGALGAVRRATSLPPAEAMRPEPPPVFRSTGAAGARLAKILSTVPRMILRNLGRRPSRTGLSVAGIALAAAILVVGNQSFDIIDYVFDLQYSKAEREDATVIFSDAVPFRAAQEIERAPGVLRAEIFRAAAVTLRHGHRSKRTAITGVPGDADLTRVVDQRERVLSPPPEGLLLSQFLAGELGVSAGDTLDVELMDGSGRRMVVPVSEVVDDVLGASATMDRGALDRLVGGAKLASGAQLALDAGASGAVFARLTRTAMVASVALRQTRMDLFRHDVADSMATLDRIEITFAVIIAFSIVYNSARTALSERARELATMRVLGFSQMETSAVLTGEIALVTAAAIPLGLALGYGFSAAIDAASASELLRLPLRIAPSTYALSAIVVALSTAASSLTVVLRVRRLDLVSVLKTRD
jgi:putative ABC transport system permease protein